ncbi:hypothetical protein DCS_01609 [Drechmeria coniospora]|uniref:Uncharacterized protein n=1 Tax=Drechmeria coniospora TaxID=98403 RepID=A0A151GTY3_DRECN|nr:hypothetical protein DCS_01609 [Drechmeria coniospora]KYK60472.1 hypothetical protein DCS_01609 [Drechmeria coniospora]
MAASPPDLSQPAAAIFDIYNDATAHNPRALPAGGCNYVDLTPGATGAQCGCRRFWTRLMPGSPISDQAGWCMCNHHACYHDHGPRDAPPSDPNPPAGQENEKPKTDREPLSPMLDISLITPPALPGIDLPSFGTAAPLSFVHDLPAEDDIRAIPSATQCPPGSMPDTLAWGDFLHCPVSANTNPLPPIPSQCLMASQTASTTSSVQTRYLRPFAGKGLNTLSGAGPSKPPTPSPQPSQQLVATRQQLGYRTDRAAFVNPEHHDATASRPQESTQTEPSTAPASGGVAPHAMAELADVVSDHGRRLDRVENTSFHEDCHDRFDNLDVRMAELETRVDEVEKLAANDNASLANMRVVRDDDAATQSIASAATSVASRAAHSQDFMTHIHSLQAQVSQLQSYLPSLGHAWEIEVVFLPFPLKRLWQEVGEFKTADAAACVDDWTQLPMTHSGATGRSQSPFYNEWAAAEQDVDWLLPRACGDASITDRRLRSRGLIQSVAVKAPDYRSVQSAVNLAFAAAFREMQMGPRAHSSDPRFAKFVGLQQSWVPLRKIHKDSRLRFLSAYEMMNPSLWDVQFLNSVMMRSSQPRLFITHPDAYLQDRHAYETGWSWQRVREMSRVYPDVPESQEVPEADALEEHWSWTEQLDDVPSPPLSMGMRRGGHRVSMSPLIVPGHDGRLWRRSTSPAVWRAQSPVLTTRRPSLPPHIRTVSVLDSAHARSSPMVDGRRVMSYGKTRRSTPSARAMSQAGVTKKRPRSPNHLRFTPRRTASPSPLPPGLRRGETPCAYATPYSNVPLQEIRPLRSTSVARTATEYATDLDYMLTDINIYENASDDESYVDRDEDESVTSEEMTTHAQPARDSQPWQLPEDEPWPGIEDQEGLSDGENIDPQQQQQHDDRRSDASSQPSEYPSTNRAAPHHGGADFRIHEDE